MMDGTTTHDFQVSPCVGSGLCCKTAPCPYGQWDELRKQCSSLEIAHQGDGFEIYRCGQYEHIRQQPGSEWVPAFGAGCCMTLFNANRQRIIRVLREGLDKDAALVFGNRAP
jgi:hypothetical protein